MNSNNLVIKQKQNQARYIMEIKPKNFVPQGKQVSGYFILLNDERFVGTFVPLKWS